MIGRFARTLSILLFVLILAGPFAPCRAANAEDWRAAISAAAAEEGAASLQAAVVTAIARAPGQAEEIIAFVVDQAPGRVANIVDAATEAFPAFTPRLQRAANDWHSAAPGSATGQLATGIAAATAGKLSGEVALGGSRSTGNTETEQVNADIKLAYERGRWTTEVELDYDFASDADGISAQRLAAEAGTEYGLTERTFAFGVVDYVDDRFSGFEYEATIAGGLGYQVINSPDLGLKVSAGPAVRLSKNKVSGEKKSEPGARTEAKFRWRISDAAKFTNATVVTFGTERTISENSSALTMKIMGSLSGRLAYTYRHNSDPPAGKDGTDTLTVASLVYSF